MLSPQLLAVLCLALVVPAYCWPGMPRYMCHCPENPVCATYTCRSFEFVCTCGECSCFPPEKSKLLNDVSTMQKEMDMLDMLFREQYQALLGKK